MSVEDGRGPRGEPQLEVVLDGARRHHDVAHGQLIRQRAGRAGADDQVHVPGVIQQVTRVEGELRLAVTAPREGGADFREGQERQASRLRMLESQPVRHQGLGQDVHFGLKRQNDERRHEVVGAPTG